MVLAASVVGQVALVIVSSVALIAVLAARWGEQEQRRCRHCGKLARVKYARYPTCRKCGQPR